jgi:hypothetical protein
VQYGQDELGYDMLRGDEVDVVTMAYILELHVPFSELFGGEVEAVSLMSYIMVLAKYTAKVTAAEEDGAAAVVALYAWLFTEMRGDDVDLDVCANETGTCSFISVHIAEPRTEVAVPQVGVSL